MTPDVARGASVWPATQSGSAVETIAQHSVSTPQIAASAT